MTKVWTIYVITAPNGLQYVGSTTASLMKRWYGHVYHAMTKWRGPVLLCAAIREHGPDSFTIKALATAETCDEADKLERHYVKTLNTLRPNGLNVLSGGIANYQHDDETRHRMSLAKRGEKHPGLKVTPAIARQILNQWLSGTKLKDLAAAYGVSMRTVAAVTSGTHWTNSRPSI